MADKRSPQRRRPPRLRAVPPALRSSGEPFEGFHLLVEHPCEAGVILWQLLRDVTLWVGVPEPNRVKLFSPKAPVRQWQTLLEVEVSESVRPYLLLARNLLSTDRRPEASELAQACRKIAEWADEQSRPQTAIAFAQAAALAWPESPEYAYRVGLLSRRNSQYSRAETWFRRSIALSRLRRDMQSRALSLIGLGKLYLQRGDFGAAKLAFTRALRTASRSGLSGPKTMALHDLFGLAVEMEQVGEAEVLAQKAARAFGSTHPRLPILAHDIAAFWRFRGFPERALTVFEAVLPLIKRPSERLQVVSAVARAAGGAGRRDAFLHAWVEAWQLIDSRAGMECKASSALKLAYGAASLVDWERAELAAGYARDLSGQRQEREVFAQAEALLVAVERRTFTEVVIGAPAAPAIARGGDVLAQGLVRKLEVYAGVKRDRPRIPH